MTEETLVAAGGAGVFRDLCWLYIANKSTAKIVIEIRDATLGTTVLTIVMLPERDKAIPIWTRLPQATANNNWTAQADVTPTAKGVAITAIAVQRSTIE